MLTQSFAATRERSKRSLSCSVDEHLTHCLTHAIHNGDDQADAEINEASAAIARLIRS